MRERLYEIWNEIRNNEMFIQLLVMTSFVTVNQDLLSSKDLMQKMQKDAH